MLTLMAMSNILTLAERILRPRFYELLQKFGMMHIYANVSRALPDYHAALARAQTCHNLG